MYKNKKSIKKYIKNAPNRKSYIRSRSGYRKIIMVGFPAEVWSVSGFEQVSTADSNHVHVHSVFQLPSTHLRKTVHAWKPKSVGLAGGMV